MSAAPFHWPQPWPPNTHLMPPMPAASLPKFGKQEPEAEQGDMFTEEPQP
jgi:hypothetical protein